MKIPKVLFLPLLGTCVVAGMLLMVIFGGGPTENLGEAVEVSRDTLYIHDTTEIEVVVMDTIIEPSIKYVARHDTTRDTVYIEKLRHYEVEQTFTDSAHIKHVWDINEAWGSLNHQWDYSIHPHW